MATETTRQMTLGDMIVMVLFIPVWIVLALIDAGVEFYLHHGKEVEHQNCTRPR